MNMKTLKRLFPWLLLGLSTFALMGSDSDCDVDIDDDHISIDTDDGDNWFEDLFDKRIVSMLPAADYFA